MVGDVHFSCSRGRSSTVFSIYGMCSVYMWHCCRYEPRGIDESVALLSALSQGV